MTIITIRQMEGKGAADSPNATLSFDNKGQYPITVTNPTRLKRKRVWHGTSKSTSSFRS